MIKVPLKEGRTLHHDIEGRHGAGKVILRSAPPGTGIIAGGPMRAVFEVLGVQDVVAKSIGSSNPYNMVRATVMALGKVNSPRQVAARRGKKVSDVINQRIADNEVSLKGKIMATKKITIKQIGSALRRSPDQKQTLIGLGLNKMHKVRDLEDTSSIRGMIKKVNHLVKIVNEE